jgi:hypothetical protein
MTDAELQAFIATVKQAERERIFHLMRESGRTPKFEMDEATAKQHWQSEAAALLPYVGEVMREADSPSPPTEEQLTEASLRRSRSQTSTLVDLFAQKVESMPDSFRKEIAKKLMENARLDTEDMNSLSFRSTEEQLAEVSDRIVSRGNTLTQWVQNNKPPRPEAH